MKKVWSAFLLIAMLPINLLADACTNPDEYTIDRRCYVDGATWAKEPYKHVLKMGDRTGDPWCTANMVAGRIVTAKHCVLDKDLNNVKFTAFDGTEIYVDPMAESGSYYTEKQVIDGEEVKEEYNFEGDWAVLTPKSVYQKFVTDNSIYNVNGGLGPLGSSLAGAAFNVDFAVIGFGALKIMSDKEIKNFRRAYVDFLYDNGLYDDTEDKIHKLHGKYPIDQAEKRDHIKHKMFKEVVTVDVSDDSWGQSFFWYGAEYMEKYGLDRWIIDMDTDKLKVSYCLNKWDKDKWGDYQGCQSWGGNSGGGAYSVADSSLNGAPSLFYSVTTSDGSYLLGILTRGWRYIGGTKDGGWRSHASSADIVPTQHFTHKLPDANKR